MVTLADLLRDVEVPIKDLDVPGLLVIWIHRSALNNIHEAITPEFATMSLPPAEKLPLYVRGDSKFNNSSQTPGLCSQITTCQSEKSGIPRSPSMRRKSRRSLESHGLLTSILTRSGRMRRRIAGLRDTLASS